MIGTFFRKALYGAVGSVALTLTAASHALGSMPAPADIAQFITQTLVIGGFTGLAGVVKRLIVSGRGVK